MQLNGGSEWWSRWNWHTAIALAVAKEGAVAIYSRPKMISEFWTRNKERNGSQTLAVEVDVQNLNEVGDFAQAYRTGSVPAYDSVFVFGSAIPLKSCS